MYLFFTVTNLKMPLISNDPSRLAGSESDGGEDISTCKC